MSVSTGLISPPVEDARDPAWDHERHKEGEPSDACMFCSTDLGLRSTGEDPLGFIDHLEQNDNCRREYELWKQVITDEWQGD